MKFNNLEDFTKKSMKTLTDLYEKFSNVEELTLSTLERSKTVLVIVDMINGFAREGALMSKRVEGLIPEIVRLSQRCDDAGIVKLAFADAHTEESPEFFAYPSHCLRDTSEAEVVEEIKAVGGYKLILKNSTNGYLEEEFQNWLGQNLQVDNFIVVGDCTDICIQQFAISLKTWFHMNNKIKRIIVPVNAVETYDFGLHNGDLTHIMALYNMLINGVEIVAAIK